MHENYPIFPENSDGLTRPLHRILFSARRFCKPESFPLRTLRENGLGWMSTTHQFYLSNTAVCMRSLKS